MMKAHASFLAVLVACASAPPRPVVPTISPPLLAVPTVPSHPSEIRAFVTVPIDWDEPDAGQINLFFRILGTDTSKPWLVFFNGGPALPASRYVSLDHAIDTLKEFEPYFRILLIDQRGTGFSAPLDVDSKRFDPVMAVQYFASPQHARDAAAAIDKVIPPGKKFYLLTHSYGGQIAFHYLAFAPRKPTAAVLAAPGETYL